MNPVQVDWLSLVLAPVTIVSLGFALFAARKAKQRGADRVRLPTWGRVAQTVGVVSALFVGFINIVWGG